MAGLLDWIDQNLGTRLGLLVNDPSAAMQQMNQQAGAYNQASILATQAERNAMKGLPVTPEQAAAKQYVDKKLEDVGSGFAGTFIGKNAKLWDKLAEQRFLQLEKAGVAPEQIWKETGTLRGLDKKLRQEFSDKNATAAYTHLQESGTNRLAEKAIDNPLYEANYPHLSKVSQLGLRETPQSGSFEWSYFDNPQLGSGHLVSKAPNLNELKSVGIHEMQHGIQKLEGFSPGTNLQQVKMYEIPQVYLNKANKLMDEAENLTAQDKLAEASKKMSERNKILNQGKYAVYARNAGEVEARLAQNRMNLTDLERRSMFPLNKGQYGIDVNPKKITGLIY